MSFSASSPRSFRRTAFDISKKESMSQRVYYRYVGRRMGLFYFVTSPEHTTPHLRSDKLSLIADLRAIALAPNKPQRKCFLSA